MSIHRYYTFFSCRKSKKKIVGQQHILTKHTTLLSTYSFHVGTYSMGLQIGFCGAAVPVKLSELETNHPHPINSVKTKNTPVLK